MRFLLTPVGSGGDVHPYIGLGRALQARGHAVILFGAEPQREVVQRNGIEFVATVTAEEYHAAIMNPDLFHPHRGLGTVLNMIEPALDRSIQMLEERYVPGETMLVGHPLSFYARILEDQHQIPAATIHLAPSSIRSAHQVPALPPGIDISRLPLFLKQAFWYLIDWRAVDPLIAPVINQRRTARGLPPVKRIFQDWVNSPQMVIGLFPDWFGPRQPDWPAGFHHASFPLWDDAGGDHMDLELTAFLDAGSPPVVATPGTANRHATSYFAAVARACENLGLRAVFLTGYPEQLPPNLPGTTMVRKYIPFSEILPRAAAFIHHGGIGSLAQGFAAGVPQLIMPMAFDQPDNALRATRLGVARWLSPAKFTPERVAQKLNELIGHAPIKRAAATWRDHLRESNGIATACDLLERGSVRADPRREEVAR